MESLPDSGSLGSLFQFIKKRGWLIILGAIVGLAAAETLDVVVKRYYSSTAQIEIVPDMSPQFRLEQIQSMMGGGSGDDSEKLDTEIQILQSPTLELDTIQALHLNTNPTFLPYKYGRPWNLSSPLERETIIKQFNNDVDVKRWQHTDIIQVKMTTGDPALSSLIANTLIDKYIE